MEQLIDKASQDRKLLSFMEEEAVKRGFLPEYTASPTKDLSPYASVKSIDPALAYQNPQR